MQAIRITTPGAYPPGKHTRRREEYWGPDSWRLEEQENREVGEMLSPVLGFKLQGNWKKSAFPYDLLQNGNNRVKGNELKKAKFVFLENDRSPYCPLPPVGKAEFVLQVALRKAAISRGRRSSVSIVKISSLPIFEE